MRATSDGSIAIVGHDVDSAMRLLQLNCNKG